MANSLPRIGILFAQLAPYHVDRCQAAAKRLAGRAEVVVVEVASRSTTYQWDVAGEIDGATKRTLFPGGDYDMLPWLKRLVPQIRALGSCQAIFVGISYAHLDIILLALWLRLRGRRVIVMTESKFDDVQRSAGKELVKRIALATYAGALVGAQRQRGYLRFLGFRQRPVVEGYDTVDIDRVRAQGGEPAPGGPPFAARDFVFVGRFVAKKSVPFLLEAFAAYVALAGENACRLVLVGSGPLEEEIRARIAALGLADRVVISGFLQAKGVATILSGALALVLPSVEEQWGLVVNEALAFCLPIIVSDNVGARDALVRNLVNGFVVESGSVEGLARALLALAGSEQEWRRMIEASRARASLAHTDRFADGVETLLTILLPDQFARR